jgi:hypothetical protein
MILIKLLSLFSRRKPKQHNVQKLVFLTEQDENSEKNLKTEFSQLFGHHELVKEAYLALAQCFGAVYPNLTLCLSGIQETDEKGMVSEIGEIVRKKFRKSPLMDIIFLTDFQEVEVRKVCKPFYTR